MDKKDLTLIKEGLAEFYIYNTDKDSIPSKTMNVFYNSKMAINRDISLLAINAYQELFNQDELLVVDSMAASGVSAIRILKECKNIKKIYINDINPEAVRLINKNIKLNNLNKSNFHIEVFNKDANLLFSELRTITDDTLTKPNVISIDPFGTPNLYVDSAFKALQKVDGLMCITATDTAVLFGVRPNTCIRKYMSKPLHTEFCKEIGTRILLYFISRIANINKMGIVPLLSFYSGHFIRIFCLSFKNKKRISKDFQNFGYLIYCKNCGFRYATGTNILFFLNQCPICKNKENLDYAGPLWNGKLHNIRFVKCLLHFNDKIQSQNKKRIEKILNYAIDEIDMPISYYNIHKLCRDLKLPNVPKISNIIKEIKKIGFLASRTHFDFLSIKTNLDLPKIRNILVKLQK
ncbi:MAG: tRNA (guanine(10)-N(2))-dimethyltransferase [Promethearchaeota archaeon]